MLAIVLVDTNCILYENINHEKRMKNFPKQIQPYRTA